MSQKYQRHSVKSKNAKKILGMVSERLGVDLEASTGHRVNVEVVEADTNKLILIDGDPLLFRVNDTLFPTLLFTEFVDSAPKIVVDMGAVRYVCKGADIMAPGIVKLDGEFSKGDLVVVVDVKHGIPLALGESYCDAKTVKTARKGAVIKNLHYVSDKIWNLTKAIKT